MEEKVFHQEQKEEQGVLLYYKYVTIPDPATVVDWFRNDCTALGLLGRVRVASNGINVTVGGKMASLEKHIAAVDLDPLFKGCDFKLAPCQHTIDQRIAKECGFTSLSVRVVKEVVTLGFHPLLKSPSIADAGKHLSANEFHSVLQMAEEKSHEDSILKGSLMDISLESKPGDCNHGRLVLLDARNSYETSIGKFLPPKGVDILDPKIRQYSDLPAWIDMHSDQLRGNCILMYCTGGVRCEMASAYIRMKGSGYENVYQLSGGIQRYLEAYPNGGFFKGKNFVFDHRISVGSSDTEVIGSCLLCANPFDDYSARCRCSYCRMLVLVCSTCQGLSTSKVESPTYICELCRKRGHNENLSKCLIGDNGQCSNERQRANEEQSANESRTEIDSMHHIGGLEVNDELPRVDTFSKRHDGKDSRATKGLSTKKLKILCLHGFRQNASNLRGRLASFTRKLKYLADFVFVDAPHEVPFIYQPCTKEVCDGKGNGDTAEGCTAYVNHSQPKLVLPQNCKKKFAWLVAPNCYQSDFVGCPADLASSSVANSSKSDTQQQPLQQDGGNGVQTKWIQATVPFDRLQYKQQTAGWTETLTHLQGVFSEMGPFNGVLGFSQGASVAATLCILRQINQGYNGNIDFDFVILCSGFPSPAEEFQQLISQPSISPIDCPSLHIFGGNDGLDRQIMSESSMELVSFFKSDCCVVLRHSSGHIIPAQSPYIDRIKDFLHQFI
eukprot:Gb_11083 [translate_table: standard]